MSKIKTLFIDFKNFISKGNVFDLAVGVIIGAAFKGIIDSFVNDIIMPPIGFLTAKISFSEMFIALSKQHFDTVEKAKEAGVVVIQYGLFVNQLVIFLITALVVFIFIYKFQQLVVRKEEKKYDSMKEICKYCLMDIPKGAKKCHHCTSILK